MTTSSASMQLVQPSIIPSPPISLAHSTLSHLTPYHIPILPPPTIPTPPSIYVPRPTSPPSPHPLPPSSSSPSSLLEHLLRTNKAREQADAQLKAEVAAKVRGWREEVATATSHGVRVMEERTFERARLQWSRWEEAKEDGGERGGRGKKGRGVEPPPSVGVIGFSHPAGGERVEWEVKEEVVVVDDKKKSKKEREKEEAERRQREMSLAHSPLSSPPGPPSLPFPAHESVYLGSALPVTLSSFALPEPLPTSDQARALLASSTSTPTPESPWVASTSPSPIPLLSLFAGVTLLPTPPLTSSHPSTPPSLPPLQHPLHPSTLLTHTLHRVDEEVRRCKEGLVAEGVWVHEGVLERGLGGGEGGLGGVGSGVGGGGWPVPFGGLVEDPKQKKKGTTEKKAVAKGGKAGKKK